MAQVALIERQKFQYGGIVRGSMLSGDTVPAALNPGEMVLTREMQSRLFQRLGSAGGTTDNRTVHVHLAIPAGTPVDQRAADRIEDLVRQIGPAILQAEYEGRLEAAKNVLRR